MKNIVLSLAAMVWLITTAGYSAQNYKTADNYKTQKIKKIAVLIVRVGNFTPSLPSPVSLAMDYANRVPVDASASNTSGKIDVLIDDNFERIQESFPKYPYYKKGSTPGVVSQYFKNMNSAVFSALSQTLIKKGYQVIDVRAIGEKWKKPPTEMTAGAILKTLKGKADALLILHYNDVGEYHIDTPDMERLDKGLSVVNYTAAMFKIPSKSLLFQLEPTGFNMNNLLNADQELLNNPAMQKRIVKTEGVTPGPLVIKMDGNQSFAQAVAIKDKKGSPANFSKTTDFQFTEKEVMELAAKYMQKGFDSKDDSLKLTGLDEMLP